VSYVSLTGYDRSKLSADVGRGLMEKRCIKCHTLERIFLAVKTEDQWTKCVNEMAVRDPSILPPEAAQIIYYLSSGRAVESSPQAMMLAGLARTDQKCGRCHLLEKVYAKKRPKAEWAKLVDGYAKAEPVWISHEDARIITEYLGAAHSEEAQIVAVASTTPPKALTFEDTFTETCNSCHSSERILKKAEALGADRERWKPIVLAMQKKGADVADDEVDRYVDYLSKLKK
jgi:mono/diheme cytochrome c family protein